MNLFDEYKELYYHEMKFSDRLNQKISNSITMLTIVGAGEILVWNDCLNKTPFNIILFILCLLSLQCFLIALYKFYRAYSKYTYGYYPIKETKDYVDQSLSKMKSNPNYKNSIRINIENQFALNYMKCAIINREQNLLKSNAHRKLNRWIVLSIISVFLCYGYDIIIQSNILKFI